MPGAVALAAVEPPGEPLESPPAPDEQCPRSVVALPPVQDDLSSPEGPPGSEHRGEGSCTLREAFDQVLGVAAPRHVRRPCLPLAEAELGRSGDDEVRRIVTRLAAARPPDVTAEQDRPVLRGALSAPLAG